MSGVSPVICSPAGVASIHLFPKQICFWTSQSRWKGVLLLCNYVRVSGFLRHPVKPAYTYITYYIRWYVVHNPVHYNIGYIARYIMFFCYITHVIQKKIQSVVTYRLWPEVFDLCHTFLHVEQVKKPTAMRE